MKHIMVGTLTAAAAPPQRQNRGQPFAAGLLRRHSDPVYPRFDQRMTRFRSGTLASAGRGHRVPQQSDGKLVLVTVVLAQLVEHP